MKKRLPVISLVAVVLTIFISISAMAGWLLHMDLVSLVMPGQAQMKFNAALGFIFSSASLLLFYFYENLRIGKGLAITCALLVAALGLLSLIEYVYGTSLGIDNLFVKDDPATTAIYYSGRMSPLAALNFIFIGTGLLLFNDGKYALYQFYYLAGIAFVSLLMIIVFNFISDFPTFIKLGVNSSLGFIFIAATIWFSQPRLTKRIGFERRIFSGFIATIVLIIMISLFSVHYSNKRINMTRWIKQTNDVLREARQIASLTKYMQSGEQGFLITGDSTFLEDFSSAISGIANHIGTLKKLTNDNQPQREKVDSLAAILKKRMDSAIQFEGLKYDEGYIDAGQILNTELRKFYTDKIMVLVASIQQDEDNLLAQRETENEKSIAGFNRASFSFLSCVFVLLIIIVFAIRRNRTIGKRAGDALTKLNNELELKVIERTENLANSEMRFRSLIENSTEGITLTDESFNVIYHSPAAIKITGVLPSENPISRTHAEDIGLMRKISADLFTNPGVPISFQGRFLNAYGNYSWLEGTFTNLLHVNGVNAVVSNYRDITRRKEAEVQLIKSEKIYKTIASGIPDSVICLLDAEYRYLLIEGDMLEKLGYEKDKLLGNKAQDVLPPELFEELKKEFELVLKGETVIREATRQGYDTISRFVPLRDENNKVYAIMTVAIDVTKLKNAQRDIIELNRGLEEKIISRTEQLRKSNEEMEAFSYSISHDLRAPLRAIIGFANILEEDYTGKLDEEATRITNIIKSNALKMGNLIDDLLTFYRTVRQDIIKSPINMNDLVREVIGSLAMQAGSENIHWDIHLLRAAKGDINTLRQVWVNLISNAIKYSGNNNSPRVEIGSFNGNSKSTFFIRDNGVGFNEKYKDKLFKVFQRLHAHDKFEGTGVGLAIVDKIIKKHGGKVWAEAIENEGATFYFSLPDN